jgi:Protein of unknown function (DUF3703).
MSERLKKYIDAEIERSEKLFAENDYEAAFRHLERAHILGQAITYEHTRTHFLMLKFGWRRRDFREIFGQIFRIVGAVTKTPFGIYPKGNTGGAYVSPFKPMPIPEDLQAILRQAKEV